mmetsp:Transcript_96646/g.211316  ORF Transcript_96646/g.211316 Transcript_96646/m.211316 type:complete len:87 (+) Transcript_96646:63-323(+)
MATRRSPRESRTAADIKSMRMAASDSSTFVDNLGRREVLARMAATTQRPCGHFGSALPHFHSLQTLLAVGIQLLWTSEVFVERSGH